MKKVFLPAALALAVAGSWAFYPKAPAEPGGYMILSLRITDSGRSTLVTIAPDGQETVQPLSQRRPVQSIQAQALVRLNELRSQGWLVAQMTTTGSYVQDMNHPLISPSQTLTETYLLDKK